MTVWMLVELVAMLADLKVGKLGDRRDVILVEGMVEHLDLS